MQNLTVISKETFRRDHASLPAFDTVIVDEAHTCLGVTPNIRWKNKVPVPKSSQLFEALQAYLIRTKPERLYLCTATIIKSPMTVWGASKILGANWDWHRFREVFYFKLPIPGREVWVPRADKELKDKLAALVRKLGYVGRLEDWFDVPDQTYRTVHLDLKTEQKARIRELAFEYPDPIVRAGKINQVENGILAADEFNDGEQFDNEKIDKILDLTIEFPKMIVFCKYRAQISMIRKALEDEEKKVFILTGDTTDRGTLIKEVNDSEEYVFIVQAQISAGWEVPNCPVMVFASRTYSFVDYDQSLGRIQRANNIKKNLYINLVVKGGVDEAVDKCLTNKKDFSERLYVGI